MKHADYAVDGALLYASFLSKEFDVLAIGISGEEEHRFKMSHYLHLKEDKKAYPLFDDIILTVKEYFDGINQSNYKFNQDYAKLIAYTNSERDTSRKENQGVSACSAHKRYFDCVERQSI